MPASCECCVLSGRGLFDGPITLPDESYQMQLLKINFSQNTTNLWSIINVATCFDS